MRRASRPLINEINGMDSTGTAKAAVPTLFGMNFQAVSVGQKLPKAGPGDEAGLVGGYADASRHAQQRACRAARLCR